jgi:alcohol dehydrogenase (cytochrome c)/quinohemoprotein ethanol dehydrogenase
MQAPKNGFLYVIEVATGKVLSADLTVPGANWLTGFDEKNNWKPILNPHADIGRTGKGWNVAPYQTHVWYPQAFDPKTGLLYVPIRFGTGAVVAEPDLAKSKQGISMGAPADYAPPNLGPGPKNYLLAWDPARRKAAWKAAEGSSSNGVLSTGGNLVFQGNGNNLLAFRADTGEKIWTGAVGANVSASFVSYSIDGVQYLAGAGSTGRNAGGRLVVFKLGGNVEIPPASPPPPQVLNPPANFGDAALLARGEARYKELCTICHEARLNVGGFPDLRYSPFLGSEAAFRAVVLDGALAEAGMLPFTKAMSREDAEAVRAHLVNLANTLKASGGAAVAPAGRDAGAGGRGAGAGGRGDAAAGTATKPAQPGGGMGIFAEGAAPQPASADGQPQMIEPHQ